MFCSRLAVLDRRVGAERRSRLGKVVGDAVELFTVIRSRQSGENSTDVVVQVSASANGEAVVDDISYERVDELAPSLIDVVYRGDDAGSHGEIEDRHDSAVREAG